MNPESFTFSVYDYVCVFRFEISEVGQAALPAIDVADDPITIGSGTTARIRLPSTVVREVHVRIAGGSWRAVAEVVVDGARRREGESGAIGSGTMFELGAYRVRVTPAPAGATPTPPQRTESLARELVRALLGDGSGATLEVERGPVVGARRLLAPPESALVIGRGDEATWVIVDEDLSRTHAEVRCSWDGMRIVDLGSKNGTRLDGMLIDSAPPFGGAARSGKPDLAIGAGAALRDGALIELGKVAIRFRDPAERHLRGEVAPAPPVMPVPAPPPQSRAPFWIAIAVAVLAVAGLAWILAS